MNRLREFVPRGGLTTDADIPERWWLPVDLDPCRPRGIPTTDDELAAGRGRRDAIAEFLKEAGFPEPLVGVSGNGANLLYRIKALPVAETTDKLIVQTLAALDARFSDDTVEVDKSVGNPSRLWRVYYTINIKGTPVPRSHRLAYLESVPAELVGLSRDGLEWLASQRLARPRRCHVLQTRWLFIHRAGLGECSPNLGARPLPPRPW
jgi:hypothetical protein